MLQLIRAILKDPEDGTQCFLLFANQVGMFFSILTLQTMVWAWQRDVAQDLALAQFYF